MISVVELQTLALQGIYRNTQTMTRTHHDLKTCLQLNQKKIITKNEHSNNISQKYVLIIKHISINKVFGSTSEATIES